MSPEPGYGSADRAPGISLTWCVFALKKHGKTSENHWENMGKLSMNGFFLGGFLGDSIGFTMKNGDSTVFPSTIEILSKWDVICWGTTSATDWTASGKFFSSLQKK